MSEEAFNTRNKAQTVADSEGIILPNEQSKLGWVSGLDDSAGLQRRQGLRFFPSLCSATLGVWTLLSTTRSFVSPIS